MARIAFSLVFALLLVLVIQSGVSADPSVADQMGQAATSAKGAAESMAASATDAAEDAKDTASSWSGWFSDKLEGLGLYDQNDDDENGRAAAPKSA